MLAGSVPSNASSVCSILEADTRIFIREKRREARRDREKRVERALQRSISPVQHSDAAATDARAQACPFFFITLKPRAA